jgi:hypothetical protein
MCSWSDAYTAAILWIDYREISFRKGSKAAKIVELSTIAYGIKFFIFRYLHPAGLEPATL